MDSWKNIAHKSQDELRDLQGQKLHFFLNNYLYPFSPHYRSLFDEGNINPQSIQSVEDLAKIPFTSKVDFIDTEEEKNKPINFILQPDEEKIKNYWPKSKLISLAARKMLKGADQVKKDLGKEFRPIFVTFTTGTTNTPTSFTYSQYDIDNLHVSGERMLDLFEIDPSERIINMFPFAPHLAFWQVAFGGLAAGVLTLSTGGGKVMGTEGNIKVIGKMKPVMLLGVPSYVYHVIRVAQEKKIKLDSIKKVVLGAARCSEEFKAKLRLELAKAGAEDVSIMGTYGFTESRCAWAECPTEAGTTSGYFLYPDKEIFEVIDPETGEVKGEGEDGELVYTSIDSRGSAVIRYRTGDFVKGGITYQKCPHTGMTVPRISNDITRLSDVKGFNLSKVKGQLVNLNHFMSVLSDCAEIKEWQIEIRKKDNDPHEIDELVLYLCEQDGTDRDKLESEIKTKILNATEVSPNVIEFVAFEKIIDQLELETASKEKRIIDNRPKV